MWVWRLLGWWWDCVSLVGGGFGVGAGVLYFFP